MSQTGGYLPSGGQAVSLMLDLGKVTVHWTEDPELFVIYDNGTFSKGQMLLVCESLWNDAQDYGLDEEGCVRLKTFAAKYGIKLE